MSELGSASAVDLIVADHAGDRPPPVPGTVLRVNPAPTIGHADVVIGQSTTDSDAVTLTMASGSITLRLVTTAAETEAIGRPRGLARDRAQLRG